jgi:protein-L-isoaspartate(D-aspartate) O-methyltransferase
LPERAPFDAILVTAAVARPPDALLDQLREGGHMVIPIGDSIYKDLKVITRTADGFEQRSMLTVTFGPADRARED